MEKENQETEVFDIMKIFEEIATYRTIPEENILDFILEEKKGDTARFYYRHMLLQLLENDEHLTHIITTHSGINSNAYHRKVLEAFARGDADELKKIIGFARDVTKLYDSSFEQHKISKLIEQWRENERLKRPVKIEENTKKQAELKTKIENIKKEIELKYKGIKGLAHFKQKRWLEKSKKDYEDELIKLEEQYPLLKKEQIEADTQAQENIKEIREIFSSLNLQELGEKIINNLPNTISLNFEYRNYSRQINPIY